MKRKLMVTMALVAVMIGCGTSTVFAGHGPLPGFGAPPPEMGPAPQIFDARMAKILKLTKTQKSQIKALLDAERQQVAPLLSKMNESRAQLKKGVEATVFDEASVRLVAEEMAKTEIELIVSHTKTLNEINALLTPEQRELLAELMP